MEKPVFKDSFSVDDIHKLREYHYEITKDITTEERIKEINDKADEVEREVEAMRAKRVAVLFNNCLLHFCI